MTHPRTNIRNQIVSLLEQNLSGIPVFKSKARALPKNVNEAVAVYVTDETISAPTASRGRAGGPVNRNMVINILAIAINSEDLAADRCDEICRNIELVLTQSAALNFESVNIAFDSSERVACIAEMRFTKTILDNFTEKNT